MHVSGCCDVFLCVFFFLLFPHPLLASKWEEKTAKSLDDTPVSDQEVGSGQAGNVTTTTIIIIWKHMTVSASAASSPSGTAAAAASSKRNRPLTPLRRLARPVTDGTQQAVFHIALRF